MAFVCIDSNQNVNAVFSGPQEEPMPDGYAVISDSDVRLTAFYSNQSNSLDKSRLKNQAQTLLDKIDTTYSITADNGLAWPAEWQEYRQTIRQIRSSGTGSIPDMPANYPDGTPCPGQ